MHKVFLIVSISISTLYPHSGGTNSEGCHNQRGGTYHCHGKKTQKATPQKISSNISSHTGQYNCERKYCKNMISCNEAYYKINVCGHTSLDRDHDGIPCENICL